MKRIAFAVSLLIATPALAWENGDSNNLYSTDHSLEQYWQRRDADTQSRQQRDSYESQIRDLERRNSELRRESIENEYHDNHSSSGYRR